MSKVAYDTCRKVNKSATLCLNYGQSDAARFWSKVRRTEGCWEWSASVNHRNGYGQFIVTRAGQSTNLRAHRVAWELTRGPIPDGLHVLHTCDNARCCNPDHLLLGSHALNMRHAAERGRLHTPRPSRHKLTPEAVASIKAAVAAGVTRYKLAQVYGVSKTMIAGIVNGTRRQYDHLLESR